MTYDVRYNIKINIFSKNQNKDHVICQHFHNEKPSKRRNYIIVTCYEISRKIRHDFRFPIISWMTYCLWNPHLRCWASNLMMLHYNIINCSHQNRNYGKTWPFFSSFMRVFSFVRWKCRGFNEAMTGIAMQEKKLNSTKKAMSNCAYFMSTFLPFSFFCEFWCHKNILMWLSAIMTIIYVVWVVFFCIAMYLPNWKKLKKMQ